MRKSTALFVWQHCHQGDPEDAYGFFPLNAEEGRLRHAFVAMKEEFGITRFYVPLAGLAADRVGMPGNVSAGSLARRF